MGQPKSESSGTIGPRRDRKAMNKYAKDVLNSLQRPGARNLAPKKLNHLAQVIEASQAAGRFNDKDAARLGKLIKQIHKNSPIDTPRDIPAFRRLQSLNNIPTTLGDEPGKSRADRSSQNQNNNNNKNNHQKHPKGWGKGLGVLAPGKNQYAPGTKADRSNDGNPKTHNRPVGKNRPAPHKGRGGNGRRGGGGPNTSTPGMIYYGLGEFPGVSRKEAETIVGNDINRQVRDLINQAQGVRKDREFDVNQTNTLFNRTKGDLNYIYGEAGDAIQGQNAKLDSRFNATGNDMTNLFSQLQSTQAQNNNTNRDAAMAELQRLGIQQTGMGNYGADANFAQTMANQGQTNTMANLQAMQTGSAEIGNLLGSMSQAALASAVGRAQNARQDAITASRQDSRQNLNEIQGQIGDVRSQRGNLTNELFQAMDQNAYQRWAETQQQDFNNQLAANQFNLDVSKLNSDNWLEKAKLRQAAAAERAKRRRQREYEAMLNQGQAVNADLANLFGS